VVLVDRLSLAVLLLALFPLLGPQCLGDLEACLLEGWAEVLVDQCLVDLADLLLDFADLEDQCLVDLVDLLLDTVDLHLLAFDRQCLVDPGDLVDLHLDFVDLEDLVDHCHLVALVDLVDLLLVSVVLLASQAEWVLLLAP